MGFYSETGLKIMSFLKHQLKTELPDEDWETIGYAITQYWGDNEELRASPKPETSDAALPIGDVVKRAFRAYNKDGIVKLQSTAITMEEAIQKTYDVLGDDATLYNYQWVD